MNMLSTLKRMVIMMAMCLCLLLGAVPVMDTYAAAVQTESQAAQGETGDAAENDEETFFMIIMMGGALLIILFAVISAMATVSSSVCVAANMDVDGE